MSPHSRPPTPERILVLAFVAILALLFVWFEWELLFLIFAGLLLAILLHTITIWIDRHTPLSPRYSYLATLLLLAGLIALAAVLAVPRVIDQLAQVTTILPQSIARAKHFLDHRVWGHTLLEMFHHASRNMDLSARLSNITSTITEGLVDLIVVVVIGFFGALNPRGYTEGLLLLFPESHRSRARHIGEELVERLRWWMLGQMVPMAVLGIGSMITLWLLGVHLAFILGLFTGFMVFIPYAGTILAGIPCVLMALQRGASTALWVLILYSIFHVMEGYILTPMVQKRAVQLPPVLTVLAEFFLWSFAGVLGVAIAAPLTAAAMVLTNELYIKPRDHKSAPSFEQISHPRAS